MKKKLFILLIPFLLAGCSSNNKISETSSIKDDSDSFISEEISVSEDNDSIESISENNSDSEEIINKLNPLDEPDIAKQYYLNHIGNIYDVWNEGYLGKGVTVAVIDEGFNINHQELKNKISSKSGVITYENGSIKKDMRPSSIGGDGNHGTFCAGVVGASLDGKGTIGIAPECELLLIQVDAKPKSICEAFKYAADNGARVITISIGSYYNYEGDLKNDGSDLSSVFNDSLNYCYNKGVVVCSAGGNGGERNPTEYTYPGSCNHVIGVGGLKANSNQIWSGSSYNSSKQYQFIDVFAPSDGMYGCSSSGYAGGWNGTSFASPQVAGLAALYFEKYPNKTNIDFENDLYNSCTKFTSTGLNEDNLGYGRINASKLMGINKTGNVEVKLKSNNSNVYLYIWNSKTGNTKKAWPGDMMNKSNNIFTYTVDSTLYDSIIFTYSNDGPQSLDLSLSSFRDGHAYDLTSPISEQGCQLGKYINL